MNHDHQTTSGYLGIHIGWGSMLVMETRLGEGLQPPELERFVCQKDNRVLV